jgi:hypothetical protein
MPYLLRKVRNQEAYMVKNAHTGQVHSHHASRSNALKQIRLLHAIDHGFVPTARRGGARVNPKVKKMYDYLSSLYPKKTLLSVANEIIKLSKGGGAGRASDIAKYIISAIGVALAVALAIFIQSQSQPSHNAPHHPPHHPPHYEEIYPNAPPHPPSYEDLYGYEPSAPPKQDIGYAYGNESFSGRSSEFEHNYREPPSRTQHSSSSHTSHSGNVSMDYEPHFYEPPARKGKSTHKIDVLGGKRRRRRHKLY